MAGQEAVGAAATKHRERVNILERFTGAVRFSAEVECAPDALPSLKLRLAVEAGVRDGANLYGANLDGANLDGANLDRANLDGANLYRANLYRANLYRANLDGANLDRANLYGANLDGANLYRANLDRANLDRANLDGANLYRANLDGANLYRANLYGANLDGANLDGANLDRANLYGANLDGANLDRANLDRATLDRASGIIPLGCPNGWHAHAWLRDGFLSIRVGCQEKRLDEARAYWAGKDDRREVLAAVAYAEAVALARGWAVVPVATAEAA